MTEMNFFVPYSDQHSLPNHIKSYESSSMFVGLLKIKTGHSNNLCIDISFSAKVLSSLCAY